MPFIVTALSALALGVSVDYYLLGADEAAGFTAIMLGLWWIVISIGLIIALLLRVNWWFSSLIAWAVTSAIGSLFFVAGETEFGVAATALAWGALAVGLALTASHTMKPGVAARLTPKVNKYPGSVALLGGFLIGLAVALYCLLVGANGSESEVGASLLAAVLSLPTSMATVALIPALRWIRYWGLFVVVAPIVNWTLIGLLGSLLLRELSQNESKVIVGPEGKAHDGG